MLKSFNRTTELLQQDKTAKLITSKFYLIWDEKEWAVFQANDNSEIYRGNNLIQALEIFSQK